MLPLRRDVFCYLPNKMPLSRTCVDLERRQLLSSSQRRSTQSISSWVALFRTWRKVLDISSTSLTIATTSCLGRDLSRRRRKRKIQEHIDTRRMSRPIPSTLRMNRFLPVMSTNSNLLLLELKALASVLKELEVLRLIQLGWLLRLKRLQTNTLKLRKLEWFKEKSS